MDHLFLGLLLEQFVPDHQQHPVQFALKKKLQKLWHKYGTNLLHCYDIPGLPPDNLKIESLFSNLRRHQRRISGRKSVDFCFNSVILNTSVE
ncbi:MAG: hypothetical protein C6Y22_25715 [Hapalosiphonaceae cyanobacterium JJU2]|nr:MAG: hypothetical protein C6Y22_25715 [Hapalosiphonaceae cyanobacterium JJU2]